MKMQWGIHTLREVIMILLKIKTEDVFYSPKIATKEVVDESV